MAKTEAETLMTGQITPVGEVGPAEEEFRRKQARIRQYLTQEGGMDSLWKIWNRMQWRLVGESGSVKEVFRPVTGVLQEEGVCLRRNVSDDVASPLESAASLRSETKFLKEATGRHFVRVYAHAPLKVTDKEGIGEYDSFWHWEIVDFVDGMTVNRYKGPTPAVKLKVILAACECEREAMSLDTPVWLSDLQPDAFKVQADGQIKMIDVQVNDDYPDQAKVQSNVVARELAMLCLELFPGYNEVLLRNAVNGYFEPEQYKFQRRWALPGKQFPSLDEVFRLSDLPDEVKTELKSFLAQLKYGELEFKEVPVNLAGRILPIAQRLEREESAAKAEKAVAPAATTARAEGIPAAEMISPVERRKSWQESALEMGGDNFAAVGFKQTGNEIVAAAAFEFRAEIASGAMTREMFTAMMREVNGIAKTYEAQLGRPKEQKLPWPQVVEDMGRSNIAETVFNSTGSRVAAAAAYRFRDGISTSQDQGASFKEMMRKINGAVGKYRVGS